MQTRPTQPRGAYPRIEPKPEKDWTVLYVFNGDNDLKENTSHQMMELVRQGAPEDSYVAAFCARGDLEWAPGNIGRKLRHSLGNLFRRKKDVEVPADWEGNRVFVLNQAKELPEAVAAPEGEVSDPATIENFLEWGIKAMPSKHVAVIFSTHGDGHNGFLMDSKGREMSLPQLRGALEKAAAAHGDELDLVGMESCNMAQAEVGFELHDVADAMVASPSVLYGTPWNHPEAIKAITTAKSGLEAATGIVGAARENFGEGTPTISAIDLEKMPELKGALDQFGTNLLQDEIGSGVMERMIYSARSYGRAAGGGMKPQRELIDLYGFCQEVLTHDRVEEGPARESARAVSELLDEVVPEHMDRNSKWGEGHGLSIFTPTMRGLFKPLDDNYTDLKMSKEGDWDDFIAQRPS